MNVFEMFAWDKSKYNSFITSPIEIGLNKISGNIGITVVREINLQILPMFIFSFSFIVKLSKEAGKHPGDEDTSTGI